MPPNPLPPLPPRPLRVRVPAEVPVERIVAPNRTSRPPQSPELPPVPARLTASVSRVGSIAVYEMGGSIYAAGVDGTGHLQPLGRVGQIHAVQANLRYPASIELAVRNADVVINLVGLLFERRRQRFDALHVAGAHAVAGR